MALPKETKHCLKFSYVALYLFQSNMCFKGLEVRCLSASWIVPQMIWLFCVLSQRTHCRTSSPDLIGTEVILAGELAWWHCPKSTYHHRHAKDPKNCLVIPLRVQDKGRSRTAMGDDQMASAVWLCWEIPIWSKCVTWWNQSSVPS